MREHAIPAAAEQPRHRTEAGLRAEELKRVRAKIAAEKAAEAARPKPAAKPVGERPHGPAEEPGGQNRQATLSQYKQMAMGNEEGGLKKRAQNLTDPRVVGALNAALNKPNQLAAELYKSKNQTRLSAERKH